MRHLSTTIALLMMATGCTDRDLGSLSESEAYTVVAAAKSQLQKVHEIALVGAPYPQTYEYGCESGTINMRISTDEMMNPVALRHSFESCASDGLTFRGDLNYVDIAPGCPDESGFVYIIGGMVEVGGPMEGYCYIETRENCGVFSSGHICGYAPSEITTAE